MRPLFDLYSIYAKTQAANYGCSFRVWSFCLVQLDHIFSKGVELWEGKDLKRKGVLRDVKESDHFPLWVDVKI